MTATFNEKLTAIKATLKQLRASGPEQPSPKLTTAPVETEAIIDYNPEIVSVFDRVQNALDADLNCYLTREPQTTDTTVQPSEESLASEQEPDLPADFLHESEIDILVDQNTGTTFKATASETSFSRFTPYVYDAAHEPLTPYVPEISEPQEQLSPAEYNLYAVLLTDFEYVEAAQKTLSYSINTVAKMKKAIETLRAGRINDALTVLRNAKRDDPHNRSLSFALSQLFYFKALNGHAAFLPEARNEAKRATLSSDEFDRDKLLEYRYIYTLCESHFDKEKAIELIRAFYLLNPDAMTGRDGLFARGGLHLKIWCLMKHMPETAWRKFEIDSLVEIIKTAPGGLLMYDRFLRRHFKRMNALEKPHFEALNTLEGDIAIAVNHYKTTTRDLDHYYDADGVLTSAPQHPWLIMNRYLSSFLQAAALPTLDSIFLNCSLNARQYTRNVPEEDALRSRDLKGVMFWQVWGMSITPDPSAHSNLLLPIVRVGQFSDFLKQLDDLLARLDAYEQEMISKEKWEIIRPYMPFYQYQSFIHVGAGPRAFKTTKEPYFVPMHRRWSRNAEASLPSNIMRERASAGAFTSVEEIVAAFHGIEKIINDPHHGLNARAKEALKRCLQDKEQNENEKNQARAKLFMTETHFKEYWWLYFLILPVGIALFSMISSARNLSDIITNLLILGLMVGAGFIILFVLQPKKNNAQQGRDHASESDEHH